MPPHLKTLTHALNSPLLPTVLPADLRRPRSDVPALSDWAMASPPSVATAEPDRASSWPTSVAADLSPSSPVVDRRPRSDFLHNRPRQRLTHHPTEPTHHHLIQFVKIALINVCDLYCEIFPMMRNGTKLRLVTTLALVDSGLKDDLVLGDPNAPLFVLWNVKLRPVPSKLTNMPFFDLMSFPRKLRASLGVLGLCPPPPGREESIEEFVRRNLGDEVFQRLIEQFCSGVYVGDPSKLSMKVAFGKVWKLEQTCGSIIGGTFKAIQEKSKSPKEPRDQ